MRFLLLSLFLLGGVNNAFSAPLNAIYGEDDRKDIYEVIENAHVMQFADATLALIRDSRLSPLHPFQLMGHTWYYWDDKKLFLDSTPLKDRKFEFLIPITKTKPPKPLLPDGSVNPQFLITVTLHLAGLASLVPTEKKSFPLCPGERFAEQPFAAFCSGALIASDLVLTAGHCMDSEEDCQNTRFVFGFRANEEGVYPKTIPSQEVYGCGKILYREDGPDFVKKRGGGEDFALIQLDRKVSGHAPLTMNFDSRKTLAEGDPLLMVGHPLGLPQKVTAGATVKKVEQNEFSADLDAYSGNSGSPVFNARTGLMEGVLTRGLSDFSLDSNRQCVHSRRMPSVPMKSERDVIGGYEKVKRISTILERLEKKEIAWWM